MNSKKRKPAAHDEDEPVKASTCSQLPLNGTDVQQRARPTPSTRTTRSMTVDRPRQAVFQTAGERTNMPIPILGACFEKTDYSGADSIYRTTGEHSLAIAGNKNLRCSTCLSTVQGSYNKLCCSARTNVSQAFCR